MARSPKDVVFGDAAERDFSSILNWTAETFGAQQAERYADLLLDAVDFLVAEPDSPLGKERNELGVGFKTYHLPKPGRHFILYKKRGADALLIVRILHDGMELSRHLPRDGAD